MLVASVCFATMGALVKLAAPQANLAEIVLARGLVPALCLGVWAFSQGHSLRSPVARLHWRRSGFGITAMWCGFYATTHLPLATATTLMYTSPLFIALLLRYAYKHTSNRVQSLCILLGFAGVLMVLQPVINGNDLPIALVGLCAGMVSALAYMQLKSLGQVKEPEWRTVFYFAIMATLTSALWLVISEGLGWTDSSSTNKNWSTWLALLGLGLFGGAGNLALTRSFGSGSTWMSAALQYTTIVFSSLYGIALFDQHPNATTLLGMACIMGCGAASAWLTQHQRSAATAVNAPELSSRGSR